MKVLLSILLATGIASYSSAQLITYPGSPNWLISQDFLGSNYVISNVQYTGAPNAIGQFDASATNINLETGILLTTGTIHDSPGGPHGPNNNGGAGIDNNWPSDTLLNSLLGNGESTYDAARLEFDITTTVDSIAFRYVFGSEEYPEYVNSQFIDVFAIIISGPGIPGLELMNRLPNMEIVSINNVNASSNSAYYQQNGDGQTSPYQDTSIYIQYDGFTKNTVARKGGLQIGETYHIIIAIADALDGILDSGLFIESCETCNYMVDLNEVENAAALELYPNPASTSLTINFKNGNNEQHQMSIVNIAGQVLYSQDLTSDKNVVNIEDVEAGSYFIIVSNESGITHREKVVIK